MSAKVDNTIKGKIMKQKPSLFNALSRIEKLEESQPGIIARIDNIGKVPQETNQYPSWLLTLVWMLVINSAILNAFFIWHYAVSPWLHISTLGF